VNLASAIRRVDDLEKISQHERSEVEARFAEVDKKIDPNATAANHSSPDSLEHEQLRAGVGEFPMGQVKRTRMTFQAQSACTKTSSRI